MNKPTHPNPLINNLTMNVILKIPFIYKHWVTMVYQPTTPHWKAHRRWCQTDSNNFISILNKA
ncbi:hypothetical protein SPRA44_760111 [Serratia proteamaculans]|nr:hypothetical protein SPRA44_760111 [Serratia proteamaculans]